MSPLNKQVLRLAVPSILANITIPLVGIVDVAITGHLSDASAIGGIAVGTMLFDLLYWNFGFLRVGTSGMTAQAYGRGDKRETTVLLLQSTGTAVAAALFLWMLQWLFVTGVLWLMPCSEEVADFARRYFFIRIWAAPATLVLMAMKGWFIGMQNAIAPMATDIVVNVVNMAASYLLAVHTPTGALGVAWGTLIAQYSGLLTACGFLFFRYRSVIHAFTAEVMHEAMQSDKLRKLFVLNGNLFIRSLCFMVVYVGYTVIASAYGDTELAVSAILMKLFMLFSYFVDGFAYAGEALTGRLGVGEEEASEREGEKANGTVWRKTPAVRKVVRLLFRWAVGIGVAFSLLYWFLREPLVEMMTDDTGIIAAVRPYYLWLALMPIISSLAFMWDGVYIGATDGTRVRNCMIWAAVGFVATYAAAVSAIGTQALYAAYFMHLLVRTVYLTVRWRK